MGYLLNAFRLFFSQHRGIFIQLGKGIVGCAGYGDTTLKTIRVIIHNAV